METQPPIENNKPPEDQDPGRGISRRSWILITFIAVITLLVIAGMSAVGGARAGMSERAREEAIRNAIQIQEQYHLAVEDLNAGRDELARQRFQWVIQHDPGYPGAADYLADIMFRMGITASPTPQPTPTLTPTPDTRSRDELYESGRLLMASGNWTEAIDTLLNLRKVAPDYHPVEVDGWLYIALRYRGVDKIKQADLEGGTYDLALAERFGPLDVEAYNYRLWAELYTTGASFWDIDWPQAVNYFGQLRVSAPYLRDRSGWTTTDRYRIALYKYGDWLAMQGRWCDAQIQYQASLDVGTDSQLVPTAVHSVEQCETVGNDPSQPLETPEPPGEPLPTEPSGEEPIPTETPDPEGEPVMTPTPEEASPTAEP
jgi:tetratricopeptide (TPR) repeat protein